MSQSAGAGSPVFFRCYRERKQLVRQKHVIRLTGRDRPYLPPQGSAMGTRSTHTAREYKCSTCGHVGWYARSLCGRWGQVSPFGGGVVPIEAGADAAPSPSDCAPCTRKLARLTPGLSEQPTSQEVTE